MVQSRSFVLGASLFFIVNDDKLLSACWGRPFNWFALRACCLAATLCLLTSAHTRFTKYKGMHTGQTWQDKECKYRLTIQLTPMHVKSIPPSHLHPHMGTSVVCMLHTAAAPLQQKGADTDHLNSTRKSIKKCNQCRCIAISQTSKNQLQSCASRSQQELTTAVAKITKTIHHIVPKYIQHVACPRCSRYGRLQANVMRKLRLKGV